MSFGLKLAGADKPQIQQRSITPLKCCNWRICSIVNRKPYPAVSVSASPSAARWAEPQVFLLDEPLSNLDAGLRVQMRIEIARLHKRLRSTMIYVTHDQVEAMTLADKIVVLEGGRIAQVGKPLELYHYPANRFVAGFIGSPKMNFLPVRVHATEAERVQVELPDEQLLWLQVDGPRFASWQHPCHLVFARNICCPVTKQNTACAAKSAWSNSWAMKPRSRANAHYSAKSGLSPQRRRTGRGRPMIEIGLPVHRCHLFGKMAPPAVVCIKNWAFSLYLTRNPHDPRVNLNAKCKEKTTMMHHLQNYRWRWPSAQY